MERAVSRTVAVAMVEFVSDVQGNAIAIQDGSEINVMLVGRLISLI